jgi:hypothetical protein
MSGRAIIVSAVVVYVGVMLGCVLFAPTETNTASAAVLAERSVQLPLRGVALQVNRLDWMDTVYHEYIDKIRDVGADTVLFTVDTYQENGHSTCVFIDVRSVPDKDSFGRLIDYAHSKGLRVVLMPIVLPYRPKTEDDWRGKFAPDNWDDWWASYGQMMWYFATLAENHKVELLVVGSELVSTESQTDRWRSLIKDVRGWYKGMLTYSANWDHYDESYIKFWDALDVIGTNSYWTLGKDHNVKVDEIVTNWKEIQKPLLELSRKVNRPNVLLEAGWCSMTNSAKDPWDYTTGDPVDVELQRKLYEGFFRSWYGVKGFGGFMIWKWGGDGDGKGYSPEGKPAEAVLREWLKKDWPAPDKAPN